MHTKDLGSPIQDAWSDQPNYRVYEKENYHDRFSSELVNYDENIQDYSDRGEPRSANNSPSPAFPRRAVVGSTKLHPSSPGNPHFGRLEGSDVREQQFGAIPVRAISLHSYTGNIFDYDDPWKATGVLLGFESPEVGPSQILCSPPNPRVGNPRSLHTLHDTQLSRRSIRSPTAPSLSNVPDDPRLMSERPDQMSPNSPACYSPADDYEPPVTLHRRSPAVHDVFDLPSSSLASSSVRMSLPVASYSDEFEEIDQHQRMPSDDLSANESSPHDEGRADFSTPTRGATHHEHLSSWVEVSPTVAGPYSSHFKLDSPELEPSRELDEDGFSSSWVELESEPGLSSEQTNMRLGPGRLDHLKLPLYKISSTARENLAAANRFGVSKSRLGFWKNFKSARARPAPVAPRTKVSVKIAHDEDLSQRVKPHSRLDGLRLDSRPRIWSSDGKVETGGVGRPPITDEVESLQHSNDVDAVLTAQPERLPVPLEDSEMKPIAHTSSGEEGVSAPFSIFTKDELEEDE
ncbi:hypothetical protein CYLTODRAFT_417327 [Cylindrobasidium torrendii FP15055 ss-10]|uniref:Uncharacterized protein n=1 Tax=Cylindrobasidium torrendii FP15055 ss-10 TaxID=1314674 RepID=A0A0D7BR92_9AGAR|nr:hypothetical protein CYLTODRAFT_417327 [Cylindrobasidium torrendii FP15055 ss-10]